MKTIFRAFLILFTASAQAQVGINTTAPDAQLDIKASNSVAPANTDGLLIPRVDAFPATNPTAAQQGMMVYLTTASSGNLPGFYYWDNFTTSWVGVLSSGKGDKDWYKVGTTSSPTAITDDVYRTSKVGIGETNPFSKLHVKTNASGMTPNPLALATLENNVNTYFHLLSGTESGVLFGSNGVSTDGGILYGAGLPRSLFFRTNGNANRMIISDVGNIALGNFIPVYPLHFPATLGDKISIFGSGAAHYGFGVQSALLQMHSATSTDDIAFGYGNSAAFTENVRFKGTGEVGIGNSNPTVPLHFAASLGDKVSLWGSGANHYGFGMQSNLMQIHSDFNFSDIAFGYGSSGAFTENVRFTGDGFVGIGNNNPTVPLHFPSTLGDKIALWGSGSGYYGFSVQTLALQIHTSNNNGDVVFGHGATTGLTETMRIKGNGKVGIGETNPFSKLHVKTNASGMTPNPSAMATLENNANTYFHLLSGDESGVLFGSNGVSTDGGVLYGAGLPRSLFFRTNGNANRMIISDVGNIALGNFVPVYPLHFPATLGDKISIFGSGAAHYGIGVQSALLQMHSAASTDDIAFGYGNSAAFTENVRFKGTGEVGIGTTTPTAELEVNGFTKMGTTAPAVKMLKFTGTTAALQGNTSVILHGLTSSKILAVNILVEYTSGSSVPPSYTASAGYEYDYFVSATGITIWNKTGNSANILSKPFRILVTYEE
ncbi:hypothetical protein G4D82_05820 [Flavobacterium sp. CYK-4]|uniref:hypothetical protein n=1 Tax=Flavobacterium lotistagni TaxID=2709660 RepID=UPI0014096248|nr:hypothetical protein [Flavobacterium lotistagni]NHM06729.1 hypothetical protein [Flavobacterium lotistagni]